jgi:hypothetical protein
MLASCRLSAAAAAAALHWLDAHTERKAAGLCTKVEAGANPCTLHTAKLSARAPASGRIVLGCNDLVQERGEHQNISNAKNKCCR